MAMPQYDGANMPEVWQPTTLEEAWIMKQKLGAQACIISGGTLLRTQWESLLRPMPRFLISLESISELRTIQLVDGVLHIGAVASLRECRNNPLIQRYAGILFKAVNSIAAPSVRNLATIGGNIASSIGDTIPVLLAYDAQLHWYTGSGEQVVSVAEWLYSLKKGGYREERILGKISIPINDMGSSNASLKVVSFYHKTGRREAFIPSLVTVAFQGFLGQDGTWCHVRAAAGGGSQPAVRLTRLEEFLDRRRLYASQMNQVMEEVYKDYQGYTDAFASDSYRKQAAANLIASELWTFISNPN